MEYQIATIQYQIDVLNSEKRIIENNGTIRGEGKVNDSIPLLKDALVFYHEKNESDQQRIAALGKGKNSPFKTTKQNANTFECAL